MNTSYNEIYNIFSQKITDFIILDLEDDVLQPMLLGWMKSAIAKIMKPIEHDLSDRNDNEMMFNNVLNEIEKEIIACSMVVEWITPQVNSTMNTQQFFGGKEEKFYAQKNQLEGIKALRDDMRIEARKLRRDYVTANSSYLNG